MSRIYVVVPTAVGVGAPDVAKAFYEALKSKISHVGYFSPLQQVGGLLSGMEGNVLMEQVVDTFKVEAADQEVMIVEGLVLEETSRAQKLNEMIVGALDASVVLVSAPKGRTSKQVLDEIEIDAQDFSELKAYVVCCVINDVGSFSADFRNVFSKSSIPVLAFTPQASELGKHWDSALLQKLSETQRERNVTQAEFRSGLIRMARRNLKRIVLPEGAEPRTVKAALVAYERKIAIPVLLAKREDVVAVAERQGIELPLGIEIIEPTEAFAAKYVPLLVELRKEKGMTEELAKTLLKDPVWVGTMMLKIGEVDGLVSGAVHSTADTVRPALQVIKTAKGVKKISSVFFMCLPTQVLIYGDCAINQNPTAEELAGIAIQSYDTAKAFDLPARVAMLSYSTGISGTGDDVDLVVAATEMVKKSRSDIAIDGPLQYDAATTKSVARIKAPNSPVAGRATVLIFPDLNAGNITYKAVQRSAANVICVGPMLQGLAKPVNDLSRGALVEDIVYTIALTAIQAQSIEG